jgi:hypothetical protein
MEDNGDKSFHGFASAEEALNFYYQEVLGGRHIDCFEYRQEKQLLEWLASREYKGSTV